MSQQNPVNPNEPIAVVRGPIDAAVKRTLPATMEAGAAGNPMPALMMSNTRLAANLDALAKAVEPNPPEKMTITDYVHLATNNRVQVKVIGADLEKLVRAVTGGPLNLKLALELLEGRASQVKSDELEPLEEFTMRLAAVLTGLESGNFAFMDDPATVEYVRNCPTCKAGRKVSEALALATGSEAILSRQQAEIAKALGFDVDNPPAGNLQPLVLAELASLKIRSKDQSAVLVAKEETESMRRERDELRTLLWPEHGSTLDQRDFVHAATTIITEREQLKVANEKLAADLANKTEVLNAETAAANRYKAQVDELTKQLDEATRPAGQKARRA